MRKPDFFQLILLFLSGLVLLFLLAPLTGMFLKTSGSALFETFKDQEVQKSIKLTLIVSFATTFIFAFAAVPFSYLLARKKFPGKKILMGIINIPVVIPHSAAGIAVLGFISTDSFLGKIGHSLGFNFVSTPLGIGFAMAFVSLPFLLNAAIDGFMAVPQRLEYASYNLGASTFQTFFKVSLPIARRNILSGFILMFARGMSEFGAVVIVAYYPMITPVLIYERFSSFGLAYARPVAVLFIMITLVVFVVLRLLSDRTKK